MQIIQKKLADIVPYANNAKKHDETQIKSVAESIKKYGWVQPIVIDGDGVIVIGHCRYEAAKKLKMQTVPCVCVDDLTEEQVKALRIVDNKSNESPWDMDLLSDELEEIDLSGFDFDFDFDFDVDFNVIDREKNKEDTQNKVESILNLNKATFLGVGKYDIPQIEPVHEDEIGEIKEWIGFNYMLSDKSPEGKAVHFFIDDYQFERLWNSPEKYMDKLRRYECVLTPDFSPYADMPLATQIFNHYRKHWVGALMQVYGVKVIPTIRASRDERSLGFYLDGEPSGGVVCISSMWTSDNEAREYFLREYETMRKTLKPEKIYVYGNEVEGLKGNIEYIQPFTRKRFDTNG